jgi:quinol monooxygenase YgiN
MSHTLIAEFPCAPGTGAAFLEILLPALADTRAFAGCELCETYADQDNPDLVVRWEKWAARENHEAYMGWRMETGILDAIGPFMAGEPRFVHLSAAD